MLISTRLGTDWDHFILDDFETDTTLLEAASKDGNAAADVDVDDSSFDVGGGEGANFTADKFYFLMDLDKSEAVNYMKVSSVSTDTINIETDYEPHQRCKSGSYLTPYYPRFYAAGNGTDSSTYDTMYHKSRIPLRSEREKEYGCSGANDLMDESSARIDAMGETLLRNGPNDEGKYALQQPFVGEEFDTVDWTENRSYGTTKNVYITATGSMAEMQDGRTIGGNQYLCFGALNNIFEQNIANYSSLSVMVPNTNST
jgi:hypothetical protein